MKIYKDIKTELEQIIENMEQTLLFLIPFCVEHQNMFVQQQKEF